MGEDRMRAVVIGEPGGPEVLEVREVRRPEPGPRQIRVRIGAAGINRADLIQRQGHYPAPPGWPQEIPGLEYAGTVDAVGSEVRRWSEGDRVMGLVGGGGYAEQVVVDEESPVRWPSGLSLEEAGAVPEAFMTAYDALFRQAGLGLGESLLIHAVGSGVGTAALQLARAAGAWTVGTSRTPEKVEAAGEMGLDRGIVSGGDGDWVDAVREVLPPRGADVILDLVGGAYLEGNVSVLAKMGRHMVVGVPGGSEGTLPLRGLMGARAMIRGTVLRARPTYEKVALAREFEDRVVPLFERGTLRPVVDRVFDPEEAGTAHRYMQENRTFGKLLLKWTGE
ncbi:MAG: NAD(P)H-quinone oxidoreductase [Longimicrobiales bacterium]|nr:NAD(P)H-quinone oxidoreductase [Longimicrobiales bacterium]